MPRTDEETRLLNAFVDGAKWWQYHKNGSTAFLSEVDEMLAEAELRLKKQTLGELLHERIKRAYAWAGEKLEK